MRRNWRRPKRLLFWARPVCWISSRWQVHLILHITNPSIIFLFCDLYNWAGQIRTINVSKKGTVFVPAAEIPSCADACFFRLATFTDEGLSHQKFIEAIADFYNTINMLHPFREGNGRTQRLFFTQWIRHLGYEFDLSDVDPDEFMIATIYAAQGVMDPLIEFFAQKLQGPTMGLDMIFQ